MKVSDYLPELPLTTHHRNRGCRRLGRNPRKSYSGNCNDRKNDPYACYYPDHISPSFYREKKEKKEEGSSFSFKKSFPFFVLFFILASVVTTIFHLPAAVTGPLKELSKFLIVMAMAAIGLNTNIVHLVKTGAKPIFTGFCCWVGISLVSLGMQHMMGLW